MFWAALVAIGVAIVSMTIFGARLTRAQRLRDSIEEFVPIADAEDPWAAWQPRPIVEVDRRRPRVWPLAAAMVGLALVGAGLAGSRNQPQEAPPALIASAPSPYLIKVKPPPTPPPTPVPPTPVPRTPAPVVAAPRPSSPVPSASAVAGAGPQITGSASCTGGSISFNYSATARGANLKWVAVYVDGKVVKGGPVSGTSHNGSHTQPGTSGDHDLEVSVEDASGKTARRQFQVRCA